MDGTQINKTTEEVHLLFQPEARELMDCVDQRTACKPVHVAPARVDKPVKGVVEAETIRHSDPENSFVLHYPVNFDQDSSVIREVFHRVMREHGVHRFWRKRNLFRISMDVADP